MFSSPTAIRVLKKQDPAYMKQHDLTSLKYLFLAGEPLDEPTARWVSDALGGSRSSTTTGRPRSGWPILSAQPGVEDTPRKFGSAVVSGCAATTCACCTRDRARRSAPSEKGVLTHRAAAAAGLHDDRVGRRRALREHVFPDVHRQAHAYSTFDWATRDADGYYFVLGRTDDVINVAGHRLGTREIEEAVQAHAGIAEVAVVGVADSLKGQIPVAFAVVKDAAQRRDHGGRGDDAQGGHGHRRPRAGRDRAAGARALRDACCRRRARASCCAARSRRSPRAAIRAISRRSRTRRALEQIRAALAR
mgnify:CR=1 FL=1